MSNASHALWLIPLLPAAVGVVCSVMPVTWRRTSFGLAVGGLFASLLLSLKVLFDVGMSRGHATDGGGDHVVQRTLDFDWLTFGDHTLKIGFVENPLTAVMVAMVTFVSLWIFIYSHGYMKDDKRYARFFAFLSLFAGGMLGLCVANSLVLLFASWELVGISSYLLIGFWFDRPSAAAAAKKAFIVTKIGDIGFFIGILWLYRATGTQLLFDSGHGILDAGTVSALAAVPDVFMGLNLAGLCALLLFCGAAGKSGQFPLHVWLPDAMEGPTPVSALIHAATMVAAGVFLVARTYPLFAASPDALQVVTWIGAFTALFAATIAVAQKDIKRILAYSTVSQLGLMMLGLGAAGVAAGMFHLVTHAFFKALLFLGAGSVIHACHEEQDITQMGGLRAPLKVTFATYIVGAAALAGVFPLAGFWSKDEILAGALHGGAVAPFALGLVASFLTAFYMTRQVALVFFGAARSDKAAHAHESPKVMTVPLVVLAVFAAGIGFVGLPGGANQFAHFLGEHAHDASVVVMLASTATAIGGIALGWRLYGTGGGAAAREPLLRLDPLYRWLENRWYVDELYEATIGRATALIAGAATRIDRVIDVVITIVAGIATVFSHVTRVIDDHVVRPAVRGLAAGVRVSGRGFSRLQTGRVQDYLTVVALGAALLFAFTWVLLR